MINPKFEDPSLSVTKATHQLFPRAYFQTDRLYYCTQKFLVTADQTGTNRILHKLAGEAYKTALLLT